MWEIGQGDLEGAQCRFNENIVGVGHGLTLKAGCIQAIGG